MPAQGAYCAHCGEAIHPHAPTAGEFIHEFIGHYVALEGKLWNTLRLLVGKPGQLTREHVLGRRIPYINPLRLYLTLSLVLFALIKVFGVSLPQLTLQDGAVGVAYTHAHHAVVSAQGKPLRATIRIEAEATVDELPFVHAAIGLLDTVDAKGADNVRRFMRAPAEEKARLLNRGLLSNLPYMLIGALPLFALYLKLLYWRTGCNYGQHVVFAFHFSAFVFLLAIGMIAIPGNVGWLVMCLAKGLPAHVSAWDWVQLLPLAWVAAYLPAALRRVYGSTPWAAWGLALLLMAVHLAAIFGLVVAAEMVAFLTYR